MEMRRLNPLWILVIAMPLLGIATALLAIRVADNRQATLPLAQPTPVIVNALVGQSAPNFELLRKDTSEPLRLSSLRGKLVFLNFWATWCTPCRREFPTFAAFEAKQYDAQVLAVNVGEDGPKIDGFLKEIGLGEQAVMVLLDSDAAVSGTYGVDYFPSTFVIDPGGRVVDFHSGEITANDLARYVAEHAA